MLPWSQTGMPMRLLASSFLVVLSAGFAVSHAYLHHTLRPDGQPAGLLPSTQEITRHFHGDASSTRLSRMIEGPMKKYFSRAEKAELLTPEERANQEAALAWSRAGAPEKDFWDPLSKEYKKAGLILAQSGCLDCHSPDATMEGNKHDSPLNTYADISRLNRPDQGIETGRLLMLSHVHLLGMALLFFGVGLFLASSRWPASVRGALIVGGFSSILADIGGWWAVKYFGGSWAWLVLASGAGMAACFALGVSAALLDLWLPRPAAPPPAQAADA